MAGPLATVEVIDADELAALRLAAERYDWLRSHHVRIQGSEVWYAGAALDVRIGEPTEFGKNRTRKGFVDVRRRVNFL
ncbi:hypothetical protein CXB34_28165 [Pseudomonas amygdali pv. morsprunorum]|uniref:hypothetical protein n=1 Tax=Pseudomonas amygdali TaxID=47877 RepID=UPI000CDAE01E|nr:hypothetical protein [Pseudomonas amygdali]POP75163.1 hypothetical protein CXB34_28165 [Pseudomonas amygdali pv. morsprunorum]